MKIVLVYLQLTYYLLKIKSSTTIMLIYLVNNVAKKHSSQNHKVLSGNVNDAIKNVLVK